MKRFQGTAICQFDVDVEVIAKDKEDAEEKISDIINQDLNDVFTIDVKKLNTVNLSFNECFEILDIFEIKKSKK